MIRDEDEREECVRTRKYMNMYNNPILAVAQPHRHSSITADQSYGACQHKASEKLPQGTINGYPV